MKWFIILFYICFSTIGLAQTTQKKTTSRGTKYVYIVVGVNAPEYDAEMTKLMDYKKNYYKPKIIYYSSDIITISDFNEEKKYRLIDKVRHQVYEEDVKLYFSTLDPEETQRSISSATAYIYNSYKEASIARAKDIEQ